MTEVELWRCPTHGLMQRPYHYGDEARCPVAEDWEETCNALCGGPITVDVPDAEDPDNAALDEYELRVAFGKAALRHTISLQEFAGRAQSSTPVRARREDAERLHDCKCELRPGRCNC